MAVSITLNLGYVDGNSEIDTSKVQGKAGAPINVLSWSWGLTQTGSAQLGGGAGSGTANVGELTITKYVDKTSPLLVNDSFKGINHGGAILTCWMASGDEQIPYIQFRMGDVEGCDKSKGVVLISSVQTGAQGDLDQFVETVSLNFNQFEPVFILQKTDTTANPKVSYGSLVIAKK